MGKSEGKPGETPPQRDQRKPREQAGAGTGDAKKAYNQRARDRQSTTPRDVKTKKVSPKYTGPDPMGDLYDMATPPPKIGKGQGKPIPQGDLGDLIPKREPPPSTTKLRDHKPSAPPEKKTPSQKGEKVDMTFPPEVIYLSERKLSKAEKAERKEIAKPRDGIGFGFGKDKPQRSEAQRWYAERSAAEKAAIKDPSVPIRVTGFASKPGHREDNQDLSERRANNVASILEQEFGVDLSRISSEGLGEQPAYDKDPDTPDHKDNRHDRIALIHIDTEKSTTRDDTQKKKDKAETPQESIRRAKKVLEQHPPKEKRVAKRLHALLDKLSNPKVDDAYIPPEAIIPQDQPGNETPPDKIARHARADIQRLMNTPHAVHKGKGKYDFPPASDAMLSKRLQALDYKIMDGIHQAGARKEKHMKTASPWLIRVNNWIAARQRNSSSILSAYGKDEP